MQLRPRGVWSSETPSRAWQRKTLHGICGCTPTCFAKQLKKLTALNFDFAILAESLERFRALTFRVGSGAMLLCCYFNIAVLLRSCQTPKLLTKSLGCFTTTVTIPLGARRRQCAKQRVTVLSRVSISTLTLAKIVLGARRTLTIFTMLSILLLLTLRHPLTTLEKTIVTCTSNWTWATTPRPTCQVLPDRQSHSSPGYLILYHSEV